MKRTFIVVAAVALAACSGNPFRRGPTPEMLADSLYWKAVVRLQPNSSASAVDSAVALLDAYLVSPITQRHRSEAMAMRRLAAASLQLSRVESALQVARTTPKESDAKREGEAKPRDEEMVKEIQRLKDELAKANEELDRIKKRLATPKP